MTACPHGHPIGPRYCETCRNLAAAVPIPTGGLGRNATADIYRELYEGERDENRRLTEEIGSVRNECARLIGEMATLRAKKTKRKRTPK